MILGSFTCTRAEVSNHLLSQAQASWLTSEWPISVRLSVCPVCVPAPPVSFYRYGTLSFADTKYRYTAASGNMCDNRHATPPVISRTNLYEHHDSDVNATVHEHTRLCQLRLNHESFLNFA